MDFQNGYIIKINTYRNEARGMVGEISDESMGCYIAISYKTQE